MQATPDPAPSLLARRRSRLTRLASDLEHRHGPGRAAPGGAEAVIERAARKLGESRGDLRQLDFSEKKAVLELIWRRRGPWAPHPRDIENWLRWAERDWKPRIAETRVCAAYLRHFDLDNRAAELTRQWLCGRQDLLWGRFGEFARARRLCAGLDAARAAAEALAAGDLSFLHDAGRNAQIRTILQGSGFLVAVAEAYGLLASGNRSGDGWKAAGPLLDFFEPAGLIDAAGPTEARKRAKIALISGIVAWANARDEAEAIALALKQSRRIAGDPRAGLDDWRDIPEESLAQVEKWLVEETLETSFRIVEELRTDEQAVLDLRRKFWRSNLPFITRARLLGARKAQSAAALLGAPCSSLSTYLSDHCGFLLELRGPNGRTIIVLELNNLAQTLFWPAGDARAPQFDQRAFDGAALRAKCDIALSHLPPQAWTDRFATVLATRAGIPARD
jgi:hypothetical protein